MKADASLGRRLLLGASVFIVVALVVAAIVIGFVLHRFVQGQIDQRLDTQVNFLASTVRVTPAGDLSLDGSADGPPFDRPGRGWYWQVSSPRNVLRSRALGGDALDVAGLPLSPPPPPPPHRAGSPPPPPRTVPPPRPADGPGPGGEALHYRIQHIAIDGVPVEIVASAPRTAVMGPWREAMTTLGLSLLVLGAALLLAIVLQVRLGLRPLDRLRGAIADVRTGRQATVPEEQPAEVQPLVFELNGLLKQNAANLERARAHVANLAHGLKTPLATLSVALSARNEAKNDGKFVELVDLMERRIRHHLGRARAAALAGPTRAQTLLASAIGDLGAVLAKVHAGRGIAFSADIPAGLAVACEPQDFDEIAGNLLDNAFKWTSTAVIVRAVAEAKWVVLLIEDDGPGLSPEQVPHLLKPGQRLDETAPGFGFGLSITRELVDLYGGSLDFATARQGGLAVGLRLPRAGQGAAS